MLRRRMRKTERIIENLIKPPPNWFKSLNLLVCEKTLPDLIWRDDRTAVYQHTERTNFRSFLDRLNAFEWSKQFRLNKVKVYGAVGTAQLTGQLLETLARKSVRDHLNYLEVDHLVIKQKSFYEYPALQRLLIKSVTVVDDKGKTLGAPRNVFITLDTPVLQAVVFGKHFWQIQSGRSAVQTLNDFQIWPFINANLSLSLSLSLFPKPFPS